MTKVFRTELSTGNEEYHKIIHNLNSDNYFVIIKDKDDGHHIEGGVNYIDNNTIVIVVPKNKKLEITVVV